MENITVNVFDDVLYLAWEFVYLIFFFFFCLLFLIFVYS